MTKEKYRFTCDYKFAVGVYDTARGTLKFVDSVDHSTKTATWSAGAKALAMTKEAAISLQTGLLCNGTVALVIELPEFVFNEIINPEVAYGKVD